MPGARTICVATAVLVMVSTIFGCEDRRARPRPQPARPAPTASGSASNSAPTEPERSARVVAPLAPGVLDTLRDVHRRALAITASTTPLTRLAFGAGRLVQATARGVVFRDSKLGEAVAESDIGSVFAVGHGSDGSLFALGSSSGVRLEPRAGKPRVFPRAPFLPGASLLADLQSPDGFFVYYPVEQQLFRYPFVSEASTLLLLDERFAFDGCSGPLAALRDGAFVCRTRTGLLRKAPRGRRTELRGPAELEGAIRFLPAKRLDEVFAIGRAGQVTRHRLVPGLPVLGRFDLPDPPYEVVANEEALAFLLVSSPAPEQPRRWTLLVTDHQGQSKLRVELPSPPPRADDSWAAVEVEDKNLAISGNEPVVAIGGSARVQAFSYATGQALFAR